MGPNYDDMVTNITRGHQVQRPLSQLPARLRDVQELDAAKVAVWFERVATAADAVEPPQMDWDAEVSGIQVPMLAEVEVENFEQLYGIGDILQ